MSNEGRSRTPDVFEVIIGQVQFAVRQIDAALQDTRLNEVGELWLRKIHETLTMHDEVFGSEADDASSPLPAESGNPDGTETHHRRSER